jgi:hypothetical protein
MNGPLRRRAGIKETPVDGDLFLVLPASGAIFHLNSLGAALWRLLAEPTDETAACAALALAFPDVPADKLAADVGQFIADLRRHELIDTA